MTVDEYASECAKLTKRLSQRRIDAINARNRTMAMVDNSLNFTLQEIEVERMQTIAKLEYEMIKGLVS